MIHGQPIIENTNEKNDWQLFRINCSIEQKIICYDLMSVYDMRRRKVKESG